VAERRALRVLFVANDGFSAGHVARTIAVARGLARRATARGLELRVILATTSEAHALLDGEPLVVVRLPAPLAARRGGFSDLERRRVVRGTLEGLASSFAPDLVVVDTFPAGPHGELAGLAGGAELAGLAGLVGGRAKRALVRRAVPEARAGDEALAAGLEGYDLAIVADDPGAVEARLPIRAVRVPPITLWEACDGKSRADAREELGLAGEGRVLLVTAGGGGDAEAGARAKAIAEAITRVAPDVTAVLTHGPLGARARRLREQPGAGGATSSLPSRVRVLHAAPLQPLLAAFDGAFAAAGYNTAHELAKAGVPAALFAQPRPFDDQAARAARFERAGLARALERFEDDAIGAALAWMEVAPRPSLEAGGADRAADALLDLATGEARAR
jgi:predicted glycosyltransferase